MKLLVSVAVLAGALGLLLIDGSARAFGYL
jgi:hypothetical protein